jgi:voltage-gated potassium channel
MDWAPLDRRGYRRLLWVGGFLTALAIGGTLGLVAIDGYPWFDAFYMTIITIFTVGYGEVRPLSNAGRAFVSLLIILGAMGIALSAGAITQTIIEFELNHYFGRRRTRTMVDKLKDHFIICGYGRVGRGAAEELKEAGVPFVIIDNQEERVERAMRAGMLAVLADSTRDESLISVGIQRAKGLIASLRTDADNLFVILSAKGLNPKLYCAARIGEEEVAEKMRRAGANAVFAPYTITGARMAQSAIRPHVHQFIDFTTSKMGLDAGIEQVLVTPGCDFDGKSLSQVNVRREFGIIVLAIRRADGKMQFNPPADALIQGGDYLIVMGEPDNLRKLERMCGVAS